MSSSISPKQQIFVSFCFSSSEMVSMFRRESLGERLPLFVLYIFIFRFHDLTHSSYYLFHLCYLPIHVSGVSSFRLSVNP